MHLFSLLFCFYAFTVINRSREYNDMLSPVNPPSISSNLGGVGLGDPDTLSNSRGCSLAALGIGKEERQSKAKKKAHFDKWFTLQNAEIFYLSEIIVHKELEF